MKQRTFDSFLFKYKKNTQIFFDLSVQIKKTRERKKKAFLYLFTNDYCFRIENSFRELLKALLNRVYSLDLHHK